MSNARHEKPALSFRNSILGFFRHIFLHNGWVKIAAVLISVLLWAGLISQDETLTRDKTFTNVNVNVTGSDTMKRNNYIVTSDLDALLSDVSMVAAVPQQQFESAEASAYNLRADLSRINGTGEQEIRLTSTNSSIYGSVISTSPSSIRVNVEEYVTRPRIPVSVNYIGEVPDGWYMSTPTISPSLLTVAGPRSLVGTISRARVYLDLSGMEWEEGPIVSLLEFQLFDYNGNVVESPLLEVSSDSATIDSVLIDANLLPTRTFDVSELIETSGTPARGFRVNNIQVSPESVTVAARSEVLAQMNDIAMESRYVDIKGLKQTKTFQLKVFKPSDDAIISNETVSVTVEIGSVSD